MVGFFPGQKIPFSVVKKFADKTWSSLRLQNITSNGQGMFIMKFKNEEDLMKIVEEGTWMIGGQPFFVQRWAQNLMMNMKSIKAMSIWVKIFSIPLEFWSDKGLSLLASSLGKPFYLDSVAEDGIRLEYAKVCIEMKVDENFLYFICVALSNDACIELKIEYTWRPFKCKVCNNFGHVNEVCKRNIKKNTNLRDLNAKWS